MLDVKEANKASEEHLSAKKTQQKTAYLQSLLLSVVIVCAEHAITHIPDAVAHQDKRSIDQEVQHSEDRST